MVFLERIEWPGIHGLFEILVLSIAFYYVLVFIHGTRGVQVLSEQKIGGLIAIERDVGTRATQETGVSIDSEVTPELLINIFYPRTPLHDGGVIIQNNRIVAAACVFPLSTRDEFSRSLGTRHRAAIGITEETDAIAVVVSEETGSISVAYRGRLRRGLDEDRLRRVLTSVLLQDKVRATHRPSRIPKWLHSLNPFAHKPAAPAATRTEDHGA